MSNAPHWHPIVDYPTPHPVYDDGDDGPRVILAARDAAGHIRVGEGFWKARGFDPGWYWANSGCACCWHPMSHTPVAFMPLPKYQAAPQKRKTIA